MKLLIIKRAIFLFDGMEFPGVDQRFGDITEYGCANITDARALASTLIDGPMKVAVYRDDWKQFWLKDLSKSNIEKPSADSACTIFYYKHPERNIVETQGIDQFGGDIGDYICLNIAVARALAYSLIDRPTKAGTYSDEWKKFWLKDLSRSDICGPSVNCRCTTFYFK
ncbi:unnamed protein product [Rotaria sp. Silwood1]|nr:unnamed protein product [Rotaria sp. Silwood1]CAF1666548.1 unnamed protein product [Rotaria sp. Silwood1]